MAKPFDRAQDGRKWRGRYRLPRGVWTPAIRAKFLKVLRATGNASAAGRATGHVQMFRKRRARDPEFALEWAAAVAAKDMELREAESPFPETREAVPADGVGDDIPAADPLTPTLSPGGRGGAVAEDYGDRLRPAPKKKPKERGHVIRRTSSGRVQIALARECEMSAEIEADFLERLRATGNFSGSARAVGFQPASLFQRLRKWPAFARNCEQALDEASVRLDYRLVAHAHALMREPGEAVEDWDEEAVDAPFDPAMAMKILSHIEARKYGRSGRGRRKGPPERSFEQAVESVLAKIAAIERHKAMIRERGEETGE